MEIKKIASVYLLLFAMNKIYSQQITPFVVNSTGQFYSNSTAQLTSNVGEIAVTRIGDSNNSITQGFLQFKGSVVSIKENQNANTFNVYPNPASNEIKISTSYKEIFSVKIIDCLGREVLNSEVQNNSVDVSEINPGIYQMIILDKNKKTISNKTITKL